MRKKCCVLDRGDEVTLGDRGKLCSSAADDPSVSKSVFTITEKGPNWAVFWLKAPTTALTFKTLLIHYAKQKLTPQKVDLKLGQHNYHTGQVTDTMVTNLSFMTFAAASQFHVYLPWVNARLA